MSPLDLALAATSGAIVNVWGGILIAQSVAVRQGRLLTPVEPAGEAEAVTVVLAVRDEAATLAACAGRLLTQRGVSLRLVVVDDRSADATPQILADLAQRDDRVTPRRVDVLPGGWLAKSHALHIGAGDATDGWLLFVDADCELEPTAIATAIKAAKDRRLDLVTLWPRNAAVGFWEHLLIPMCAAVIALWFGLVPERRRPAFGNGQFLLVRRDAYVRAGGHAAVRDALIEDVPLAGAVRRAGGRCDAFGGAAIVGVRMYDGLAAIADGWSRIYVGALRSPAKLALSAAWLLVGNLMPFVLLPWFAWRGEPLLAVAALSHLVLMLVVSWRFWGMGKCRRRYLLLYPLAVTITLAIVVRAWWRLVIRRRVIWRRTAYQIDGRARVIGVEA